MTSTIPACKNCKHFQESPDEMFSTCDRYHYETVDYFNGKVTKYNSLALAMRDKEKFCGREGKNFEMKEFVEEEETFSVRKYLKEKIVNFALVLGVLKMEANK
jgi:predicted RNA-binding protein YlqC (UPF0109 family)